MNVVKDIVSSLFRRSPIDRDKVTAPPSSPTPQDSASSNAGSVAASECSTIRLRHQTETPNAKINAWRLSTSSLDSEPAPAPSRQTRKRAAAHVSNKEARSRSRKRRKMDKTQHDLERLSMKSPPPADIPMPSIEKTVSPAPSFLDRMSGWARQSVQPVSSDDSTAMEITVSDGTDMSMDMDEVEDNDRYDTAPPTPSVSIDSVTSTANNESQSISDHAPTDEAEAEEEQEPDPRYKLRPPPTASEIPILRGARLAVAEKLRSEGWPLHCVTLFTKLQLRGLEPSLQHFLLFDFGVLPRALFTDAASDPTASTAHIKPAGILHGEAEQHASFHHVRALEGLIKAGQRIRSCAAGSTSHGGEHWQRFAADAYRRWALEDAGVLHTRMRRGGVPQNLALVELRRRNGHTSASMDAAVLAALVGLEGEWAERLGEGVRVPPLYALVMTGTMVAVIALRQEGDGDGGTVDAEGSRLRPVAAFDWRDKMMDVWNAFAVAITIVHCRDLLIEALVWNVLKPVDGPQGAFTVGAQVGGRYKEEDPDA